MILVVTLCILQAFASDGFDATIWEKFAMKFMNNQQSDTLAHEEADPC